MSKKNSKEKVDTIPEIKEDIVLEEAEVICPPKPKVGVVANCKALNIRKEPSIDAEIITVLNQGSIVEITDTENDFYNIGIGYCMQKFIEVEE